VAIHWTHTHDFVSVLQNKISRADELTENTKCWKIFLANKRFVLREKSNFHRHIFRNH